MMIGPREYQDHGRSMEKVNKPWPQTSSDGEYHPQNTVTPLQLHYRTVYDTDGRNKVEHSEAWLSSTATQRLSSNHVGWAKIGG